MLKWLASLVFSSLTFAIADVLCDICIAERDEEQKTVESAADDEDAELEEIGGSLAGAPDAKQDRYARDSDGLQLGVTLSRPNAGPRYKQVAGHEPNRDRNHDRARDPDPDHNPEPIQVAGHGPGRAMGSWSSEAHAPVPHDELIALTGEQDAAIAGLVTILMLLGTVVVTIGQAWSSGGSSEVPHLHWGPTTHVQFWFAMLGGSCAFMHYYFLLKVRVRVKVRVS